MASITDCVVEGLKYPFNDVKKVLGFGVLFALINVLSTYIGLKSVSIFREILIIMENTNVTMASRIPLSQLPGADMNLLIGLILPMIHMLIYCMNI